MGRYNAILILAFRGSCHRAVGVFFAREAKGHGMPEVMEAMAPRDLSRLPVVAPGNPQRLYGIIRSGDVGRAYNVGIMRRVERQHRAEQLHQGSIESVEVAEFMLHHHSAVWMMIHDLPLPASCMVVAIRRRATLIVPHGPTRLEAGDQIIIHDSHDGLETFKKWEDRLFGLSHHGLWRRQTMDQSRTRMQPILAFSTPSMHGRRD